MSNLPKFKSENHVVNGTKVFFTCHPDDFNNYYAIIKEDILSIQNTNFFYLEDNEYYPDNKDEYYSYLNDFNLIIIPITNKFLNDKNRAYDIDFEYAINNHLPILPILVEPSLYDLFNEKCKNIQALDMSNSDPTQEPYKEKLKKSIE